MPSIISFIKSNKERILLVIILLFGAYLRLYKISGYMTFLGDEGRDVLIVKRMIVDHKFTLLGPTASVGGFFLGPIYYYFMLPFLWAWHLDPTGPAVMVALFGVATIYLVYRLGNEMFGEYAAFVASSLYAFSPLVIAYSRSSWNPNVVPFFSTLLVYSLWKLARKSSYYYPLLAGLALGVGIQLHYLFLFLFIVTAMWLICLRLIKVRYTPWTFLYILIGFIIGNSLFLIFEIRHGFPNTQSIINFIFHGKETGFSLLAFSKSILDVVSRLYGRLILRMPDKGMLLGITETVRIRWIVLYGLATIGSLGYFIYSYVRNVRRLNKPQKIKNEVVTQQIGMEKIGLLLICCWLFTVIILFGFYKKEIYDYYFGIIFTGPFITTGYILAKLRNKSSGYYISLLLWGVLIFYNWQGRPFLYPPNNQLAQMKRIAQVAFGQTGGKPFNFALLAGQNTDHAYRYFFEIWGNPPVTIENSEKDPLRRTVTDQLIVICEINDCKPLGHSLWEIAGFGRAEIVDSWNVPFVTIYKLVHYKGS